MQQSTSLSPELLAQQKAYKTSKETFRKMIRELAANQRLMKDQRKAVHMQGERRVMTAPSAAVTHSINRSELRALHLAYAIVRHQHGGYTKLRKAYPTIPTGIISIGEVNIPGINTKYVWNLIDKHGPKTVHLST